MAAAYTKFFAYMILFAVVTSYVAYATDPTQLQDFCVATNDPHNALFVNGLFCKNPMAVTADDFFASGLDKPGDTKNKLGSALTAVATAQLPGLNTLGISLARRDFAPYGLVALHAHPRATEIFTVLEGTIYVGFVTSNPENKFISKVLKKGDVFVFPQGLIHFQQNVGNTHASAIAALSSQNPGLFTVGNAVFGSQPPISVDVLSKAFQLDANVIKQLQSKLSTNAYN